MCVLVRDSGAAKLPARVQGSGALVMTVREAKVGAWWLCGDPRVDLSHGD